MTDAELAGRRRQLLDDGDVEAADDLERQTVRLAQVAEHWRLRQRIREVITAEPQLVERVRLLQEAVG